MCTSYPTPGDFMSYSFSFFDLSDDMLLPLPSYRHHVQICALAERKQKIKREISKSSEFYDRFTNQNS